MRLTLISPRLAVQKGDFLGSGVPYWPVELATLAAYLRDAGELVSVLDLFGRNPTRLSDSGDHYLQGEPLDASLASEAVQQASAFVLYAISYMSHQELLENVRALKLANPGAAIAVLENSQAVTAYSLQRVASSFFDAGVDALICGEAYFNWSEIKRFLSHPKSAQVPENVLAPHGDRNPRRISQKRARYPIPAWDLFDLKNYWSLPYSHGPKTRRFLPILTSRGCPYPCDFCVVPETNDRLWRANAPVDVVNEILALRDRFGVQDFQVEDLNPTVHHERWEAICRILIERKAQVRFYFVSGTKAETVHIDQVPLFASAGCRYISISPESGSRDVMRAIGKPFNYEHGIRLISACRSHGIRTQACFLVGHPAEKESDFLASQSYLRKLVRAGLDEVAVFIVSPFAGSALHAQERIAMKNTSALPSFSPKGREDADLYERRRRTLVRIFFLEKLRGGTGLWMQGLRALFGVPQTKMENLPRRVFYIGWLLVKFHLRGLHKRPA
jgi:anaerobic magnesium-protoporphyrin IX monomethyl ester cyclase